MHVEMPLQFARRRHILRQLVHRPNCTLPSSYRGQTSEDEWVPRQVRRSCVLVTDPVTTKSLVNKRMLLGTSTPVEASIDPVGSTMDTTRVKTSDLRTLCPARQNARRGRGLGSYVSNRDATVHSLSKEAARVQEAARRVSIPTRRGSSRVYHLQGLPVRSHLPRAD